MKQELGFSSRGNLENHCHSIAHTQKGVNGHVHDVTDKMVKEDLMYCRGQVDFILPDSFCCLQRSMRLCDEPVNYTSSFGVRLGTRAFKSTDTRLNAT